MIKVVIFDMFETLVTHYESPLYMGKQISADMGIPEERFREIWNATDDDRTLGKISLEEVIEKILRVNNCYSKELFESIIEKRRMSKLECFRHMHPEIIPLFNTLKEMDIKIGLITNCYFEERDVIKNSVLFNYFDSVCMSCELGLKKPDIEIFKKCMKDLDVVPEECLYIGDGGAFELETAKSSGMYPLQAIWYFKDGVNQSVTKKEDFTQAHTPLEVINEIKKHRA